MTRLRAARRRGFVPVPLDRATAAERAVAVAIVDGLGLDDIAVRTQLTEAAISRLLHRLCWRDLRFSDMAYLHHLRRDRAAS